MRAEREPSSSLVTETRSISALSGSPSEESIGRRHKTTAFATHGKSATISAITHAFTLNSRTTAPFPILRGNQANINQLAMQANTCLKCPTDASVFNQFSAG